MSMFSGVGALAIASWSLLAVHSHRALLANSAASCDSDFSSSQTALQIPDASISWAFQHYLDCSKRAVWASWVTQEENEVFYIGVGTSPMPRFADLRADAVIIGPGLPPLSSAEQELLPEEVRADPVWDITGIGAILHRSPSDQSTCAHLGAVMKDASTVKNGRCDFYEPFGQTNSWRILDADGNQLPIKNETYYVAVFLQEDTSGKVEIALGTWAENFAMTMDLATPTCKRNLPDWSEKKADQGACLPVLACPLSLAIPRLSCTQNSCSSGIICEDTIVSSMLCTMGGKCSCAALIQTNACGTSVNSGMGNEEVNAVCAKTCDTCESTTSMIPMPTAPTCEDTLADDHLCSHGGKCLCSKLIPLSACGSTYEWSMGKSEVNAVCAKTCNSCGAQGMTSMKMACGGEKCISAVKLWDEANLKMHAGMVIEFTCDPALDFVRGMIGHHRGAVDMCRVLTEELTCTASGDLAGLVGVCRHIKRDQEKEVGLMELWLGNRSGEAKCSGAAGMGCGDITCSSSQMFMDANSKMHEAMTVHVSCLHEVDFVRGMLPHHAGAVEMCDIWRSTSTEEDVFIAELCTNVTRVQNAEIQWFANWLADKGQLLAATCEVCWDGSTPAQPSPPCEDLLPATSFCHQAKWNCTCEGALLEVPCGQVSDVGKYGLFNASFQCQRMCGHCPAEQAPLFHQPCPAKPEEVQHHEDHAAQAFALQAWPGFVALSSLATWWAA